MFASMQWLRCYYMGGYMVLLHIRVVNTDCLYLKLVEYFRNSGKCAVKTFKSQDR